MQRGIVVLDEGKTLFWGERNRSSALAVAAGGPLTFRVYSDMGCLFLKYSGKRHTRQRGLDVDVAYLRRYLGGLLVSLQQ